MGYEPWLAVAALLTAVASLAAVLLLARGMREAADSDPERRAALNEAVHPRRRSAPLHCSDCHRAENPLLDVTAAGYPPARIRMLSAPVIFRMIENIADGQPFYLPGFVSPVDEPESAPSGSQHP